MSNRGRICAYQVREHRRRWNDTRANGRTFEANFGRARMKYSVSVILLAASLIFQPLTSSHAALIDPGGPNSLEGGLSGADIMLLRSKSVELFTTGKVNDTATWHNKKSGNRGTVQIISIYKYRGLDCRKVLHYIQFRRDKDPRKFTVPYCFHEGRWKYAFR